MADEADGLPVGGVTRVRSLLDSLPILGLEFGDVDSANEIIDQVEIELERMFEDLAGSKGNNGDIEAVDAEVGDFGIRILNSRDHFGTVDFNDPRVSRILVGGTGADFGVDGVFGIAQNVDIGNFRLNEFAIFALDAFADFAPTVPRSPASSDLDIIARFLGTVAAHEAGHIFGMIHTDNGEDSGVNVINTASDAGGTLSSIFNLVGVGPDFIFGTADDLPSTFNDDFFQVGEVPDLNGFAFNRVTKALAHGLSSGTITSNVSGRAFNDLNRDGNQSGEPGLGGVFVFADANGNGVFDPSEPNDVTDASGNFEFPVATNDVAIIADTPVGFVATTPTTVSGATANISFGFAESNPESTGVVFSDNNGNGFRDPGEDGLEGFFVYLDLNGNDVIDLGEPKAISEDDGSYNIDFPGPGPFTIRVVSEPGFELTTPVTGEYTNGTPTGTNFDFGFLPSLDFGDAPESYGTLDDDGGAKHGITAGLSIGTLIDRELDGQPTTGATGDDTTDLDDEDGVRLLSPLGPGSAATFEVTVTNTSGITSFLQGFMDFNIDGDFDDPGEQFATNISVPNGVTGLPLDVFVDVPADAVVGDTFVRFRLSQTPGIGPTGFAEAGEVEDHAFPILVDARLANDDTAVVPRNSTQQIDVLENDFQTPENPLTITSLVLNGTEPDSGLPFSTEGSVRIAGDRKTVFYTPPNGFIGRDVFGYSVVDNFGNVGTAFVTVNVTFQTQVPIALDDIFDVPEGSSDRALNVLDNDISSIAGGISITSATRGSEGGSVRIVGGGQSLRYTPAPGFNGTEQFTYSIQDAEGQVDSATVTVNLTPGSLDDDRVEFSIEIFDPVNTQREITNVQVGGEFLVRVFVEDIDAARIGDPDNPVPPKGVASGFLDLLYTDELAAIVSNGDDADITFGPLFTGGVQSGDVSVPGLIDEVGGLQPILNVTDHFERVELFTIRMQAVSPGVAVFQADPADLIDSPQSETVLVDEDDFLTVAEQRLGGVELTINSSGESALAVDDSFPDSRDSNGEIIVAGGGGHVLDVLANDNVDRVNDGDNPASQTVREFGLVTNPTFGSINRNDSGTPDFLGDDFFVYEPNVNANGLERFTYVIVTEDNIRSTAEVTIALGNQIDNADVFYDLTLVSADGSGTPIDGPIRVGDEIGIQVNAIDERVNPTFVFAGFMDVLYDIDLLSPRNDDSGNGFDFDVQFGDDYVQNPDIDATAIRPGIIDEVGTFAGFNTDIDNGNELFTVFFDVVGEGVARVVGSPADATPQSDTLLFRQDQPVAVADIRHDVLEFFIGDQQNTRLAQDVNDDGFVSPIDALLVINDLGRGSSAEGEAAGSSSGSTSYYLDVNGDNQVTAIDALQVINYLVKSTRDSGASGEQVLMPGPAGGSADPVSDANDSVIEDLSGESNIVDAGGPGSSLAGGVAVTGDDSIADDDEDDLLDLLADDVAGQWS
ncbi:MAG: Ig-like domain-containing protein [Planctomycetota bacterium]